jgi:hypothetical protein
VGSRPCDFHVNPADVKARSSPPPLSLLANTALFMQHATVRVIAARQLWGAAFHFADTTDTEDAWTFRARLGAAKTQLRTSKRA